MTLRTVGGVAGRGMRRAAATAVLLGLAAAAPALASWEVTMGTQGGFAQRNAAFAAGLVAGMDAEPLHGDTLRVFVDVSGLGDRTKVEGWSADGVVRATVEAAVLNAWETRTGLDRTGVRSTANHVQVEIRGSDRYAELARVYEPGVIVCLPSRSLFD